MRSQLDYANSVWCPFRVGLITELEKVQKRATKSVGVCRKLAYKERLKYLNLPSLRYRRLRGDMIEVFKILNGIYDCIVTPHLARDLGTRTRGNSFKLLHLRCKHDVKKYSFCHRVVAPWNSLPDEVVCSVSLNSFKNNLDKHWCKDYIMFEWDSDLSELFK